MSIDEQNSRGADRPSPQHPLAEHPYVEGPHMGPFTAGDPHVSIPAAPSSKPLARQPLVGFVLLAMAGVLFYLFAVLPGPEKSLNLLAVPTAFWLPVLVIVAVWWHGFPGSLTGSRTGAGVVNTIVFMVAAILLTFLGQVVIAKFDAGAVFSSTGGMFPILVPLAGTIFVTMLQLTFVCGRWPFDKMSSVPAGIGAFTLSWVIGVVVNLTVVNWDVIPAPARAALGLRNPGGPVSALDYLGWLVCVVVFQLIFFQLLDGWPFRDYENKLTRLVISNVFVIGSGWLLYLLLHNLFKWPVPTIIGAGGVVTVGVTVSAMAFEDYPFHHERPGLARLGLVMNVLGMAFLAFFVLRVIGQQVTTFNIYPVELWVGVSALLWITPMVIYLYAIWGRWPLPAPAPPVEDDALAVDRPAELQDAVSAGQAAETHALSGAEPSATPASGAM
jgi:hypothetical protein